MITEAPLDSLLSEGPTNGYSPPSGEDGQGTLSLKLSATSQGRFVLNSETVKKLHESIPLDSELWLKPGDLLVQRSNTRELVGTAALYDGPPNTYIYPDLMMRLRFKEPGMGRWVWRFMNSPGGRTFFQRMAAGAAGSMPKISGAKLRSMPIPVPSPTARERIADILDKADALRAKRRAALAQLDTLTQAIFLEMFGDPATGPYSSSKISLGELCDIEAPLVDPTLAEHDELPLFGPDRIERNTGVLLETTSARAQGAISAKFLFEPDCILYSKIRPNLNKVALARCRGLCSADMYPVTVDSTVATREFVWQVLLRDDFLAYAESLANRANIPKLNREQFLAYPTLCPPLKLQTQFSRRVIAAELMKASQRASLMQFDALFASLQHRAFRGEL